MNELKTKKRAPVPPDPLKPLINCAFDELVPIERVISNPRNPNQHPQTQVALLAKVIAHQGWRSPVVVSTRSGFIVAGHGRYEAAKLLGLKAVPIDYQDFAARASKNAAKPADRLPGTIEELKATKGGLVSYLFVTGKGKEEITAELKTAFKVSDAAAVKIVRRITGRARFFRQVLELTNGK